MTPRAYTMPLAAIDAQRRPWRENLWRALGGVVEVHDSPQVPREILALAHSRAYLDKLFSVGLTREEGHKLGFAWSPEVLTRSLYSTGGTLAATEDALNTGLGLNLGGGTHHAYPDHAEGYSLFNDVAVAIQYERSRGFTGRVLVVDLDVHQGNGTAVFFQGDDSVFTFSMHAEHNYPAHKEKSDLDVSLPDGTGDAAYLAALEPALEQAFAFRPALVFFNSGVDVLGGDRLGRLALSMEGLRERNARVFQKVRQAEVPLVVVFGGGYNRDPERNLQARALTYRQALDQQRAELPDQQRAEPSSSRR